MHVTAAKLVIEPMRIPVFVSCPSDLSCAQEKSALIIKNMLDRNKLAWHSLGRSDYSYKSPLTEVVGKVKRCAGGIVLGFSQFEILAGSIKPCTTRFKTIEEPFRMPTPWNHLEAGIMVSHQLPLLIFREQGMTGGVFDLGTQDVFVHDMPLYPSSDDQTEKFESLIQNWAADVRRHYYGR